MAQVLGIGGFFFKSADPESLGSWYAKWLGLPVQPPYGATFRPDSMPPGGRTVWAPFDRQTTYFEPADQAYMVNLVVDDLDGALAQVAKGGGRIVGDIEDLEYGRFGWFLDPEGNKVELWEPKECEGF